MAAAAKPDPEALKVRRQKIFIAVGGVLLLGAVGFQLPGLLGGSGSGSSASASQPAVPAASPAQPLPAGSSTSPGATLPHSIARLARRDVFAPQVSLPQSPGSNTSGAPAKGPAVRLKHFVTKDPFIQQIALTQATPASAASVSQAATSSSDSGGTSSQSSAGYIVVLASISGTNGASQRLAARAVVAAKNAGLKEVVANDSVPGTSGSAPHFTIYTGPYDYESTTQQELVRALRNGYPQARAEQLPASSGKGF